MGRVPGIPTTFPLFFGVKRGENFDFSLGAKRGENFKKIEILLSAKRGENFEILLGAKRGENFEILLRAKHGEILIFYFARSAEKILSEILLGPDLSNPSCEN